MVENHRELLHRKANIASIPPLKNGADWLVDAKAKADAFAKTFASKSSLPDEVVDTPFFGNPDFSMVEFVPFRTRATRNLFSKLDESKATGYDRISASILKRLGDLLAMQFTRVCRRLYYEGCWPEIWKLHLIVPIYKKGAAFNPGNYRGVHLTTILSKLAEKVIGARVVPFLKTYAFGENQWPFSQGLGARDSVTMLMMSWIVVCSNKKIGAYLSDISGAFDRVFKIYMLAKLQAAGVEIHFLNFLDSTFLLGVAK